jgi:peptidoglycan hydrolase-like amidase
MILEIAIFTLFGAGQPLQVTALSGHPLRVDGESIAPGRTVPVHQSIDRSEFVLSIPGKITRRFRGALSVRDGFPILKTDIEDAVAGVVAGELTREFPGEALKSQAVLARSYYLRPRHRGHHFCDTTHCQFLTGIPNEQHPAMIATRATRALVLTYEGQPIPALYSRRCSGGSTKVATGHRYPYFAVACTRHPDEVQLRTTYSEGHGIGLCQLGAAALARDGLTFINILTYYFPNTRVSPHNTF